MLTKQFKILNICMLILAFTSVLFFGRVLSFAVDEQILDRYPSAEPKPSQEEREEEFYYPEERRLLINGFINLQQGYDNNVDLDSKRHKDGFLQSTSNVDITYRQAENLHIKMGMDSFKAVYYNYNRNNLFDMAPYVGFDFEPIPGLISMNRFIFDYFWYPNQKEDTYKGIVLSTYLRQYILDELYHEVGYEYLRRWYPDQKTYLSSGLQSGEDRADDRYRVKYNIGYYANRFMLRLSNEYSKNDSNDSYQDYYDYWLYRVKPSVMFFFTQKLYTDVGIIYKYTHYKDRRSTDDSGKRERDNTYILTSSLYYDITRNLTLGVTYSYSENHSNDPFQKYSGSIVSGGLYYNF